VVVTPDLPALIASGTLDQREVATELPMERLAAEQTFMSSLTHDVPDAGLGGAPPEVRGEKWRGEQVQDRRGRKIFPAVRVAAPSTHAWGSGFVPEACNQDDGQVARDEPVYSRTQETPVEAGPALASRFGGAS